MFSKDKKRRNNRCCFPTHEIESLSGVPLVFRISLMMRVVVLVKNPVVRPKGGRGHPERPSVPHHQHIKKRTTPGVERPRDDNVFGKVFSRLEIDFNVGERLCCLQSTLVQALTARREGSQRLMPRNFFLYETQYLLSSNFPSVMLANPLKGQRSTLDPSRQAHRLVLEHQLFAEILLLPG